MGADMRNAGCAAAFLLSLSALACAEQPVAHYPTYVDAEAGGAVKRGWIPPFVPRSAIDISEIHDLDLNVQRLRFHAPLADLRSMIADMKAVTFRELARNKVRPPKLSGPWPAALVDNAREVSESTEDLGLYHSAVGQGARCVAVEWKTTTAFAWSCQ